MSFELFADCGGDIPAVDCPCCAHCCEQSTGECELEQEMQCEVANYHITQENGMHYDESRGTICSCVGEGDNVQQQCTDTSCLTCNKEETVCAKNTNYGITVGLGGYWGGVHNTLEYVIGRNDTVTFSTDYSMESDPSCKVEVNGQECASCILLLCSDGFGGYSIRCDNIPGAGNFDSCNDSHEDGVLTVFAAHDPTLRSGCHPFFEH